MDVIAVMATVVVALRRAVMVVAALAVVRTVIAEIFARAVMALQGRVAVRVVTVMTAAAHAVLEIGTVALATAMTALSANGWRFRRTSR